MNTASAKPIKPMRKKKCAGCGGVFQPVRQLQSACSVDCAYKVGRINGTKKRKAQYRDDKKRLKTRADYLKDASTAFNAFIRERDKDKPCICCGKPLGAGEIGGAYDCGHYRSVGSAPHMRFDERNAHGQRKQCNRWGSGRAVDYRIGLIARIGLEAVEAVESDQSERHWSKEDLIEIVKTYKAKRKEIERAE